ncbi:T9SS type A sorting domain-containing protein [Chitinophagaceae bacterium MMS25-I14]
MKLLHVLSIALLTSGTALAQPNSIFKSHLQSTRQRQIAQMLLPQDAGTAMKSTGLRKRVIAQSVYMSGVIQDTTRYFYSNNYQASKFDYNQVDFDNSSYNPVDYPVFSFISGIVPSGSYSLGANCDSLQSWSDDGSGSGLQLSEDQHNGYVNNNMLSDHKDLTYSGGDTYGKHFINSFDAQGRLIASIQQNYDTATHNWDTFDKKKIYYNAQGRVQKDTVFQYDAGSWVATTAYDYTYDANGNITQINDVEFDGANWTLNAQYKNTYTSNRLKTMTFFQDTSSNGTGQFAPVIVDSFSYAGSGSFYTYWGETLMPAPSIVVPILEFTRTLNSMGLPDSMAISSYNGSSLSLVETAVINYDADANPLTARFQDAQSGQTGIATYYYETFNDATSVTNIQEAEKSFTIFPNPAQDVLNIRKTGNTAVTAASVRIINTLGQNVFSGQLNGDQQVNIGNLQPGNYWISIADEKGKGAYTQAFIKQ